MIHRNRLQDCSNIDGIGLDLDCDHVSSIGGSTLGPPGVQAVHIVARPPNLAVYTRHTVVN